MMNKRKLQLFDHSFERCMRDSHFIEKFYNILLDNSDEVKEKFKNTDMSVQKEMLLKSLPYMMTAIRNPDVLENIAITHNSNNLDIKPHLYTIWLDCLIEAVKITDKNFDSEIAESWRQVMQHGINYIISRYSEEK